MVNIAVAGGSGGLGLTIVEALKGTKHDTYVLSRKPSNTDNFITVDYLDEGKIVDVLETNRIHTVVSTLSVIDPEGSKAQMMLINAAERSTTTKRFIPSHFGCDYTHEQAESFPPARVKLDALSRLANLSLEYSAINVGLLLDYYSVPGIPSHIAPTAIVIDMVNNAAGIPGSGDTPVAFIHSVDIAKFVVAMMDLETWSTTTTMIGDKKTWNEVLVLGEVAKGTKFHVSYDSTEKLKTNQITELPGHVSFYAFLPKQHFQAFLASPELMTANGAFDLPEDEAINKKFPQIKPLTVEDALLRAWKKA